ncbi:hypothetical protein CERSUDRAFT_117539 [Gelatoporia subvermispora B]|uniref:Uncharacterized protein n=1 Tax=Ceriporiopsis subvermispora (strain B) TaxID=914234 RepID=M2R551_CERS8|nr:hypothetical protein CERSUDRAFT_117539 [Gelatoporia subvermispora B]
MGTKAAYPGSVIRSNGVFFQLYTENETFSTATAIVQSSSCMHHAAKLPPIGMTDKDPLNGICLAVIRCLSIKFGDVYSLKLYGRNL